MGCQMCQNTLNAICVYYLPLIYKYGTDLAKYLPDLLYIYVRFINIDPSYIYIIAEEMSPCKLVPYGGEKPW